MNGNHANANVKEHLTLRSRISELARIPSWIEHLASLHAIPKKTQFAMNLCLEEVLSNIMRHGYAGLTDRPIDIEFTMAQSGLFVLAIDDEAPLFNPLEAPVPLMASTIRDLQVGGQGIHLLRQFADDLKYEATPSGNRLSIGFFGSPQMDS